MSISRGTARARVPARPRKRKAAKTQAVQTTANNPYIVPAVDRAVRLLIVLAQHRREMSLAQLTGRLNLPHATAFRLAYTLEAHGLLRRKLTGYEVGPRILSLGFEYLSSLDIVSVAHGELSRLRDETGASANLGVLDGFEIIYLCHVSSLRPLGSRVDVGSRMPAHGSSIGRMLMAMMPETDLVERWNAKRPPELEGCVHSLDALIAQARADRRRGWVLKRGVFESDLVAIAAPVLDASGSTIAAINISGPASVMLGTDDAEAHIATLLSCARRISAQLGYQGRSKPLTKTQA